MHVCTNASPLAIVAGNVDTVVCRFGIRKHLFGTYLFDWLGNRRHFGDNGVSDLRNSCKCQTQQCAQTVAQSKLITKESNN